MWTSSGAMGHIAARLDPFCSTVAAPHRRPSARIDPAHSLRHICYYGLTTFSLSILVHTTSHALGELVGYMCRY